MEIIFSLSFGKFIRARWSFSHTPTKAIIWHGKPADFGSRFYRGMTVQPGANRFEVTIDEIRRGPRDRELDLARVERLTLFVRQGPSRRFFLDDVRLVYRVTSFRQTAGSSSSDFSRSRVSGE